MIWVPNLLPSDKYEKALVNKAFLQADPPRDQEKSGK
jgi:hypothetical protein